MKQTGIDLIRRLEGVRHDVYRDSAGLPTIGVGHLLSRDELRSGKIRVNTAWVDYRKGPLSDAEVDAILAQDLAGAEATVQGAVLVPLNDHQYEALVSFCFNVGRAAFSSSTLVRLLNRGDYASVPAQLRRWTHSGGRVDPGLIARREREVAHWNGAAA